MSETNTEKTTENAVSVWVELEMSEETHNEIVAAFGSFEDYIRHLICKDKDK